MKHPAIDNCIRLAEEKKALEKQVDDLQAEVKELKRIRMALKRKNKNYEKAMRHVLETLGSLKLSTVGDLLYSPSGDLRVSHPADGC